MNLVDLFKEYNGRYPKGNVQDELHAWCEVEIKRQAQRIAELEQAPQPLKEQGDE